MTNVCHEQFASWVEDIVWIPDCKDEEIHDFDEAVDDIEEVIEIWILWMVLRTS